MYEHRCVMYLDVKEFFLPNYLRWPFFSKLFTQVETLLDCYVCHCSQDQWVKHGIIIVNWAAEDQVLVSFLEERKLTLQKISTNVQVPNEEEEEEKVWGTFHDVFSPPP